MEWGKMKQYEDILRDLLCINKKVFPEQNIQIEEKAKILYKEYCKQEEGKPREITMHTVKKIFPCIAFYKAVTECTNQHKQAYSIIENYFTEKCEIYAKRIQRLCHIDMIECPYFSICSACGCPELTTVFCNAYDVAYVNMHSKLSWERKKTLGRGDNCCDFILKIKNNPE